MKLDYDLIRDLLLVVEDISDGSINYPVENIQNDYLSNYELKTIKYHVKQLAQGGIVEVPSSSIYSIIDLTWYGHQYLANIRDNNIWSKTKEYIKPFGTVTLDIISEVAKLFILKKLHLNP
ncbi:DUF2513 domain-containing protein [Clostridium sporogenes]|uniref:DUF2513 domain-containing protein n=1 Tax=Clostridium sporogenes TaxID=1509 RepID=UPI0015EE6C44|nr:DUF2513 domain-containing protein [Clostridium sporogenes]MBA4509168.1 DUF2513 domain-containing protein [Clostridium sporogenes]